MYRFSLICMLLLVFCSCSNNASVINESLQIITDTTFSKKNRFDAIKVLAQKASLPDLENNKDSFVIGIWCPLSSNEEYIISITHNSNKWTVSGTYVLLSYPQHQHKKNDTVNHLLEIKIDSIKTQNLQPKSGFEKFIDTLLSFDLGRSPVQDQIDGSHYISSADYLYHFEIANKNTYRFFTYACGEGHSLKKFRNKISRLVFYLTKELNINVVKCY